MQVTTDVLWLDGAPTKMTYANGTFTDYAYTNRGFLQSIANKKSDLSVISSFSYTLDNAGNRTRVDEDTGEYVLYGYDATYQLTSETRKDNLGATLFSASYEYDAVGNRTRMVKDSVQTLYTYNNLNQMLTAGGVSFTYDANGNLISETENNNTTTYIWDYENKLKQITYPDLTTNTFAYNGDGLRVQKTDSQGTLKFIYDGLRYGAKLIATTNATNQLQVVYDYGLGLLRQKIVAGSRNYYHSDGLGSTSRLTDASETVTDSFQYEGWGNVLGRTGTTQTPFQFVGSSGYYSDAGSGLMLLGARYYGAGIGRFVSLDPIKDSMNWYAYAGNNAVNGVDPTGLADYAYWMGRMSGLLDALERSRARGEPVATTILWSMMVAGMTARYIAGEAVRMAAFWSSGAIKRMARGALKGMVKAGPGTGIALGIASCIRDIIDAASSGNPWSCHTFCTCVIGIGSAALSAFLAFGWVAGMILVTFSDIICDYICDQPSSG